MAQTTKKSSASGAKAPSFQIPAPLLEAQRRMLQGQKEAFERAYDAIASVRERQEDAFHQQLEKSSMVPDEVKKLASTWTSSRREISKTYREAVTRSYALLDEWVGGLAA